MFLESGDLRKEIFKNKPLFRLDPRRKGAPREGSSQWPRKEMKPDYLVFKFHYIDYNALCSPQGFNKILKQGSLVLAVIWGIKMII